MLVNLDEMQTYTNGVYNETACSSNVTSVYKLGKCHWAGVSSCDCHIVIADTPEYGRCLFLDGEIQSSSYDEALYHEHLVHPVLAATAHLPGKHVLIVGGGEGATAREVLKWSTEHVASVTWVDIDGDLVDMCRRHLGWTDDSVYNDSRLSFHAADIRDFLHGTCAQYDVILLDLPDPDPALWTDTDNEFPLYGSAFMNMIYSHLVPGGAIASHCGPVMPGDRPGYEWLRNRVLERGEPFYGYHTIMPSYQSDWGFMMTVRPAAHPEFPTNLRVLDAGAQTCAFTWPAYWDGAYFATTTPPPK